MRYFVTDLKIVRLCGIFVIPKERQNFDESLGEKVFKINSKIVFNAFKNNIKKLDFNKYKIKIYKIGLKK